MKSWAKKASAMTIVRHIFAEKHRPGTYDVHVAFQERTEKGPQRT
jgi:hypothetical protein